MLTLVFSFNISQTKLKTSLFKFRVQYIQTVELYIIVIRITYPKINIHPTVKTPDIRTIPDWPEIWRPAVQEVHNGWRTRLSWRVIFQKCSSDDSPQTKSDIYNPSGHNVGDIERNNIFKINIHPTVKTPDIRTITDWPEIWRPTVQEKQFLVGVLFSYLNRSAFI